MRDDKNRMRCAPTLRAAAAAGEVEFWFRTASLRQRIHLDQRYTGCVRVAAHDRRVAARRQGCNDGRFAGVAPRIAACVNRGDLITGDDAAGLRYLPVVVASNHCVRVMKFERWIIEHTAHALTANPPIITLSAVPVMSRVEMLPSCAFAARLMARFHERFASSSLSGSLRTKALSSLTEATTWCAPAIRLPVSRTKLLPLPFSSPSTSHSTVKACVSGASG